MLAAALLTAALSAGDAPVDLTSVTREIDALVLTGQSLPPDFMLKLRRLPLPGDRMQALIYLLRAGLLGGPAVSLDDLVFDIPGAAEGADIAPDGTAR